MNYENGSLGMGEPVFSWVPLILTIVSSVTFIVVAIWCFNRQKF